MIQAFILTGFLGVGKTTMLKNIIKEHFSDKKTALIVNEFGDVGIDGNVLGSVHQEVLEISEGCICCQRSDEFSDGVRKIIETTDPEVIFVETSGASKPFPILIALYKLGISIEGVICVVDSKSFAAYKHNETAIDQIGSASIIVLNKTDLVDENALDALTQEIQGIKAECEAKGAMEHKVFTSYLLERAHRGIVDRKVFEGLHRLDDLLEVSNASHDHTERDGIMQKVGYIKKGTDSEAINTLLSTLSKNVYRVKGILVLSDAEKPQLINYAFGCVTNEALEKYDGESVLVFIGESIEQEIHMLGKTVDCLMVPQFRVSL